MIKDLTDSTSINRSVANLAPTLALQNKAHYVNSNFEKKQLTKIKNFVSDEIVVVSDWKPGINLLTALYFGLQSPSLDAIQHEVLRLAKHPHADWTLVNMVICGHELKMIDEKDVWYKDRIFHPPDQKRVSQAMKIIKFQGDELVYNYWNLFFPDTLKHAQP